MQQGLGVVGQQKGGVDKGPEPSGRERTRHHEPEGLLVFAPQSPTSQRTGLDLQPDIPPAMSTLCCHMRKIKTDKVMQLRQAPSGSGTLAPRYIPMSPASLGISVLPGRLEVTNVPPFSGSTQRMYYLKGKIPTYVMSLVSHWLIYNRGALRAS